MKVYSQTPSAALQAVVSRFLVVEFPDGRSDWHLPEMGLIAAFCLRGECLLGGDDMPAPAILTGLTNRVRRHRHSRGSAMLVAHFTPLGAALVTREALDGLWNRTEELSAVLGGSARVGELVDRLSHAANHSRRIQLVEQLLLSQLTSSEPDPLLRSAMAWIAQASPSARVGDLVRHIGLSQSALERRFRRQVGTTPRQFITLLRLTRAAQSYRNGSSLTTAAHAAGYYDQAHFNHEFTRLAGLSPSAFFAGEKG